MNQLDGKRAEKIRKYLDQYFIENRRSPSVREVAAATDISKTSVQRCLTAMREHREIDYNGRRSIGTNLSKNMHRIIPATVCGNSSLEQDIIPLPTDIFGDESLFLFTVQDDSMSDIGAEKGDLIVAKKQDNGENNGCSVVLANEKIQVVATHIIRKIKN